MRLVWNGQEHEVHLAHKDGQYFGWFDITVGAGTMRDEGFLSFDELVEHWQSEMRRKN
jgi:hypothetical protein